MFNPLQQLCRQARELLLDYLDSLYPSSMLEDDLKEVMIGLDEPVSYENTMRDLAYLKDRGLAEQVKIKNQKGKLILRWKLTAKGKTFVECGKPWVEIEEL